MASFVQKEHSYISQLVDRYNKNYPNGKRFYMLTHMKGNRIIDIGLYDGKTKKHTVCDIRSYTLEHVISEMKDMVKSAEKEDAGK